MLAIVTCLFCCSKYSEIYPPALSDILFIFGDRSTKFDIIKKENEILHLTDFGFELSSISRWFEHYFTDPLPRWAMDCYLKCYGKMEEVALVVRELSLGDETIASSIAVRVGMAQKVVTLLNCKEDRSRGHKNS